jgi:dUTP pyrophosphatase
MSVQIVKIVNKSPNGNPTYATTYSSGVDVRAYLQEGDDCVVSTPTGAKVLVIQPHSRVMVHTGIYIALPDDSLEIQVRPRSGLAIKKGLMVLNSPGTIDAKGI